MQTTGIFGSSPYSFHHFVPPAFGMTISLISRSKRALQVSQARLQRFRASTTLYSLLRSARAEQADRVFIFDEQNRTDARDVNELAVAVRRFVSVIVRKCRIVAKIDC